MSPVEKRASTLPLLPLWRDRVWAMHVLRERAGVDALPPVERERAPTQVLPRRLVGRQRGGTRTHQAARTQLYPGKHSCQSAMFNTDYIMYIQNFC